MKKDLQLLIDILYKNGVQGRGNQAFYIKKVVSQLKEKFDEDRALHLAREISEADVDNEDIMRFVVGDAVITLANIILYRHEKKNEEE